MLLTLFLRQDQPGARHLPGQHGNGSVPPAQRAVGGPDTDQRGSSWFSQPVLSLVSSDTMTASPAPAPGRTGRCSWSLEERALGPAPDPARLSAVAWHQIHQTGRWETPGQREVFPGKSRLLPPTAWVPAGQGCQSREMHEDTDSSPGMGINVQCRVRASRQAHVTARQLGPGPAVAGTGSEG